MAEWVGEAEHDAFGVLAERGGDQPGIYRADEVGQAGAAQRRAQGLGRGLGWGLGHGGEAFGSYAGDEAAFFGVVGQLCCPGGQPTVAEFG
ncbi:MAG TPA: hypothetical protein VFV41_26910, partial [Streptosporangiaceae bacterium]|nr:hypothetical protein [Streptosporangiaceae bacterium]